ncbi:MAG: single-stranded DNA-binding protein [Bacilli bacterium]|nr:single-stranded DNA-binding protein [Bacilli bacterium]MDD3304972.1 single-stranded DNA-binding protein [Bacilli bacterium]MDD4053853.1 single-stranded DNA-binding protein [Bacilli bacterium]MDD4411057.1 single-stranded DNA-binding protein [Bacilli bacterium]
MNKTFLVGHLTKDPDLKYLSNNTAVATFTVAVNRTFTNQSGEREADFINVVVWRKQAENVKKYLSKGSLVGIDGRIQTRNYENQEGKRVYITEVVADNVQFLGPKGQRDNSSSGVSPQDFSGYENQIPPVSTNISDEPFADFGETVELSEDDIAF